MNTPNNNHRSVEKFVPESVILFDAEIIDKYVLPVAERLSVAERLKRNAGRSEQKPCDEIPELDEKTIKEVNAIILEIAGERYAKDNIYDRGKNALERWEEDVNTHLGIVPGHLNQLSQRGRSWAIRDTIAAVTSVKNWVMISILGGVASAEGPWAAIGLPLVFLGVKAYFDAKDHELKLHEACRCFGRFMETFKEEAGVKPRPFDDPVKPERIAMPGYYPNRPSP